MKINSSNISFKAYVPVRFFIRDDKEGSYYPVVNPENVLLCQKYLVRNLNRSIKNVNNELVSMYESADKDYRERSIVTSLIDHNTSDTILASGKDVFEIRELGKRIGRAKNISYDKYGHANTMEVSRERKSYYSRVKTYLKNYSKQLKSISGQPFTLQAFFDTKYNKKGEIKGYDFAWAELVTNDDTSPKKAKPTIEDVLDAKFNQMTIFDFNNK